MNILPISVDLRITNLCNLNCEFCFGTKIKNTLSFNDWIYIIDNLWDNGTRILVITGGEPLLYPLIEELLIYSKKKGFKIALSTNCTIEISDNILNNIDILSIPLDGATYEVCNRMRNISYIQYKKTLELLEKTKNYKHLTIKISTVVTKINYNNIIEIYDKISNVADIWKIYQVSKSKTNEKFFDDKLFVSKEKMLNLYDQINNNSTMLVKLYLDEDRNGKYLFCEPDGSAVAIYNNEEIIIGDFLNGFYDLLDNWNNYSNAEKIKHNINETFILNY